MGQSKGMSWLEAGTNVVVGYVVAIAAQVVVYPALGIVVSLGQNLKIGAIFLGIGLIRSYLLRRAFNHHYLHRAVMWVKSILQQLRVLIADALHS